MISNSSHDNWVVPIVPVECYKLVPIGIYCIMLFCVGIVANPTLICIILRNQELMNPVNLLIIALASLNLIGILIELPLVATSSFVCKFTFGRYGCNWEAFVMYFIGCSSIYILVFISYIRYSQIRNPINDDRGPKYGLAIKGIVASCLNGMFWALMPLFGWSEYAPEGAMISCCIEWNKRTYSVISYNIAITLFVYLIPLALLIFTNLRIFSIVRTSFIRLTIFIND